MPETDTFAKAIRNVESGERYDQVKGMVRNARLVGAYGFPADEWRRMAAEVGLPGARWSDPRAQDAVANRMFDLLYQKYGDWRLVAVAWKAGEEVADLVAQNAQMLNDPKLKGVKEYVGQVMDGAANDIAVNKPVLPDGTPVSTAQFQPTLRGLPGTSADSPPSGRLTPREALTGILRAMKTANLARLPAEDETIGVTEAQPAEDEAPAEKPGLVDRMMGRA